MALEQGWAALEWTPGDRIRKARRAAGYRQIAQLVEASGVPSQSLGPWEDGKRTPQGETLARVVAVLAPRLQVAPEALERWIRTGELPT